MPSLGKDPLAKKPALGDVLRKKPLGAAVAEAPTPSEPKKTNELPGGGGRGGGHTAAGTGRIRRHARDARARHFGVADHEPERARLDGVRLIPRARRGRLAGFVFMLTLGA